MVESGRASRLPAVVLTFFPHPSVVLRGRQPAYYITSPDEKAALLARLGVDYVVTLNFDLKLSRIKAAEFLDVLDLHLGFKGLWIGEDFALGYRRQGNRAYLERASRRRGFQLHVVPPFLLDGEAVRSSRIREALRSGDVARAGTYLGRFFSVPGVVVEGAGRGRGLGVPTANLEVWEERAFPAPGVYACFAEAVGRRWKAVTNIGIRPTFDAGSEKPVIEAHLLGFEGDLYGVEIRLQFVDRLRDERRFSGPEALLEQIGRDVHRAEEVLDQKVEVRDA